MTEKISNIELIKLAKEVLNPIMIGSDWHGDVASALVTGKGNVYRGVCVDAGSAVGFCAERAAIAQMFANGEQKVEKIVAVWNNNPEEDLYVLPPCGACRHFMLQRCEDALEIDVVLSSQKNATLRELYPYNEWPEKEETTLL